MLHKESTESAALAAPVWNSGLSPRFMDFWLLGGASLVVWAVVSLGQLLRHDYNYVGQHFTQIAATFGLLSIVCNHPHFIASYRMAYGRGWSFCLKHWFALIAVPVLLVALYTAAFLDIEKPVINAAWTHAPNWIFASAGLDYRFGNVKNFGSELLGASVWLMYITVGWHYAKQVFGCMLVYANYDGYPISRLQRNFLKLSVYTIAFYSFCQISFHWREFYPYSSSFQFLGVPIGELGMPLILDRLAGALLGAGLAGFLFFVLFRNFKKFRKLPTANFLVPLVAFYAWWVPLTYHPEYYFMIVPFFHSLQYLPFAFRVEMNQLSPQKQPERKFAWRLILLLVAGFVAFEALPSTLDSALSSSLMSIPLFFTIAFAVFINVHHFFIDSVLWRFQDQHMRGAILSPGDRRRLPPND